MGDFAGDPLIRMAFGADRLVGDRIHLAPDEMHYLVQVMRTRSGTVEALIAQAGLYRASVEDGGQTLVLMEPLPSTPTAKLAVILCPALIKHDLMAEIVEKGTEVGISRFEPWVSERSVVRMAADAKQQRWQRIAKEAAEQCRRASVPEVVPTVGGAEQLTLANGDQAGILWDPEGEPLTRWWQSRPNLSSVKTVVGAEGGIGSREREIFIGNGFVPVRMAPYIFRAENAGIFGALLLLWLSGDLKAPLP